MPGTMAGTLRPALRRACGLVLALATVLAAMLSGAAAQPDTRFKMLRVVVGYSTGGGYDTYARLLARHIGRHLAGQPSIIVQNMPGGASLKAIQYLDNGAPTDGSVITAFNPGTITEWLINPGKQRFNFMDVAWIGSITRDQRVCYTWAATGIKTFGDLKAARRFNMGAPTRGTSSFVNSAMLQNMFGIAVHHVMGYAGSAELRLAIERRELDGDCGAWSSVPADWIAEGKINPVIKFTPDPIAGLPDRIPFAGQFAGGEEAMKILDILTTPDLLGRPFVASKQVPADRLAAVRNAFDATVTDPQFLAETEKLGLPVVGPVQGREAERVIAALYAASPAIIARAQEIVGK
jgi:tripartite-type tricarboxylate transporter receptor subunit TctC